MTRHRIFCLLCLVFFAALAQAAAPKLQSVSPSAFIVYDTSTVDTTRVLAITGQDLLGPGTSGFDVSQRVKIFFQVGAVKQQVWMSGWAATTLTVNFGSHQWLSAPGTLSVTVETDGVVSNTLSVPIQNPPASPPQIQSVSPNKFIISQETGAFPYSFRVWAANLSDYYHTGITVDGKPAQIGLIDFTSGVVDAMLPKEFQGIAGKHQLIVSTYPGGNSPAATIEVAAAGSAAPNIVKANSGPMRAILPAEILQKAAELSAPAEALRSVRPDAVSAVRPVIGAVVTLTGKTTSPDKKRQIEEAARAIPGVVWVENRMAVEPPKSEAASPTLMRKKN